MVMIEKIAGDPDTGKIENVISELSIMLNQDTYRRSLNRTRELCEDLRVAIIGFLETAYLLSYPQAAQELAPPALAVKEPPMNVITRLYVLPGVYPEICADAPICVYTPPDTL